MHGRKSLVLLFALFILLAAQPAAAQSANPYYASCVACHTLTLDQAQGMMAPHGGWGPPPPGFIDDACSMSCHEWTPPEGHFGPPVNPFYWQYPLNPFAYPPGPSVNRQMCETCHDTTVPPLNAMHPDDLFPYPTLTTMPPPPVLPLFEPTGPPNQDPFMGGMTCSTCHNPHDPGIFLPSLGKPAFLRLGDPSGDITPLCITCHTDMGPPAMGHDIYIDSQPTNITFLPPQFGNIDIEIVVQNRGTADYFGGTFDVLLDDGFGFPFWIGSGFIPYIPSGSSDIAIASFPEMPIDDGYVFHFVLEPSQMNPFRINTFARGVNIPPPPENLRVNWKTFDMVDLQWDPPMGFPNGTPITYDVYRNGVKVNPWPLQEWETFFGDFGVNPETPYTYTVTTVNADGFSSVMSNRVGARTDINQVMRVPEEFPTIQAAVSAASQGTSIHVAPGVYQENLNLTGRSGLTIRGQDAEGVTLDLMGLPLDLDMNPGTAITISGFTITNGQVYAGEDDTISRCVFDGNPGPAVIGSGFVTNSTFDSAAPPISVGPGDTMVIANSVFLAPGGPDIFPDAGVFLLYNNFAGGFDWFSYPGEGNFSGPSVCFIEPMSYVPCPTSSDIDAGFDVGLPVWGGGPDVGPFEIGYPYTPKAPTDLSVVWDDAQGGNLLSWTASPDDPVINPGTFNPILEYVIYGSILPDSNFAPISPVPPGTTSYLDTMPPGQIVYYQVRASMGPPAIPAPFPMVSLPSNTSFPVDPPEGLTAWALGYDAVQLDWMPPSSHPNPWELSYNVYRNGRLITPSPIVGESFLDTGLVPETPHTYTVQTVAFDGSTSVMSNRFGAKTLEGWMTIRVPQDASTIQEAIWAASSGMSIHVSAGTYFESLDLWGKSGVAVVGQDAEGVILNTGFGGIIDLGTNPWEGNTLSGFTVVGAPVWMGENDTVTNCVFRDSEYDAVAGGGFVTNNIFDNGPFNSISVFNGEQMTVANSIFMTPNPLWVETGSDVYLINNMFEPSTTLDWASLPGEGNFSGWPCFGFLLPPDSYLPGGCGPERDAAADVGLPLWGAGPDVGAFEYGFPYTPAPAENLTAGWNIIAGAAELAWDPSPNDPFFFGTSNPIVEYIIYRSDFPDFTFAAPLDFVPAGQTNYLDFFAVPGVTHYYQVRASAGVGPFPGIDPIVSVPTNTVSFTVNIPPYLNPIGPQSGQENSPFGIALSADDPNTGDTLAFSASGLPLFCTLTDNGDRTGSIDCTPGFSDAGSSDITVTVDDNGIPVLSDFETFTLTVANTNRAPDVTNPGPQSSSEGDGGISLQIVATDDDLDTLSYSASGLPTGLGIDPVSGLITGSLDYSTAGSYSVDVTVTDGQDPTAVNFSWDVANTNRAPVASDDAYNAQQNQSLGRTIAGGVLPNDSDPDGDPITAVLETDAANGTVALAADGSFTYTPNPGFYGIDTWTYVANDGILDSSPATVTMDVNGTPVAVNDNVATDEDVTITIDITANDSDPDGDAINIFSFYNLDDLSQVTDNGDGTVDATPAFNFNGIASFEYYIRDARGGMATAKVWITVAPVNDPPWPQPDGKHTNEDQPRIIHVLLNDTDIDGDSLTVSQVDQGAHGTVTINPDDTVTYTPDPDWNGNDQFHYWAHDGTTSTMANVYMTVNPVNDPPAAVDDGATTLEETAVTVNVAANDTDIDSALDTTTLTIISLPANGTITAVNSDGTIEYLPELNFSGSNSFTYTISDDHTTPAVSNEATVTITVTAVNDVPVLAPIGAQSVAEGGSLAISLSATDVDPADLLSFAASGLPSFCSLTDNTNGTGSVDCTPGFNDAGGYDITVTVSDNGTPVLTDQETFTLTVTDVNLAPIASDDAYATDEDAALNIAAPGVLGNDTDPDSDPLQASLVSGTANGALGLNPDGSFTYTPNGDFNGTDSFTYTANDASSSSNVATVTITVNSVNDAPVLAAIGPQSVAEGGSIGIGLSATDVDAADLLSFATSGLPSFCSLTDNGVGTGSVDCTPGFSDAGSYNITVTASDNGAPVLTDQETFTLTVTNVNRAPVVTNPGLQTDAENDLVSLQIIATDADNDTLTYSATGLPAGLSIASTTGLISGTLTSDSDGSHSVDVTVTDGQTPSSVNFSWDVTNVPLMHVESITTGYYDDRGKTYYTADVLVLDDGGAPLAGVDVTAYWTGTNADSTSTTRSTNAGGVATFTTNGIKKPSGVYVITITDVVKAGYTYDVAGSATSGQYPPPAQNPPVANDDSYAVDEGAMLNVPAPGVLDNDTDVEGDTLTAVLAGSPNHGSVILNPDGSFDYTHDGSETTVDSFTYRANDGTADSNTATVTITINPVNDPPTAADDSASTQLDTPVIVDVLANDTDPDGGALTVSAVTDGTYGSVINNGSDVTYTPDPGYSGPDSFTYTAADGNGGFDTATVSVTISAGNLPPTAFDDTAVTDQDTPVVVDVLANDTDPDSDPLTVSAVTQPANGSVVNNGTDVTYTPDLGYFGPDSFGYTVSDGNGGFDSAVVDVTVNEVPAGSFMHVDDIAMSTSGRKVMKATAVVTVVDAGGSPVEGVTVSGDWTGAISGQSSGVTGPDGTVALVSPGKKNVSGQTITITITNLAKAGWTYDAAANVESSDSIDFP